ncbi:MAG TPA: four helix bundle protein [Anaerolineae bacterium]|nr:four helix bundle protein [Anaerolineae bacterium]
MARIEHFEEILGWQKGRELCRMVYTLTGVGTFSRDFGLRDQMRRAAVSVISNIAEGFESQSNRTFTRYLYIAKGSAGEVRAQAYIALDEGYITQQQFDQIYALSEETGRLIGGFIVYLQQHLDESPRATAAPTGKPELQMR